MSLPIWTPAELSSSARPCAGRIWRIVEAQHYVSTLKLVDTREEQEILDVLIEDTKPAIPPECRHLDYLLFTPFRYGTYPRGSRFRRPGKTPGVFYASECPETAVAELGFYRLLFYAESPETPWPSNPESYAGFAVEFSTERACDLTAAPLVQHRPLWTDLTDYGSCQDLADVAREAEIEVIRYESVRDPQHRPNLALLKCNAFSERAPVARQTWWLFVTEYGVSAVRESPRVVLGFERTLFTADPRLASARWTRA